MVTRGRGGMGWVPPKIDDVIYEQPINSIDQYHHRHHGCNEHTGQVFGSKFLPRGSHSVLRPQFTAVSPNWQILSWICSTSSTSSSSFVSNFLCLEFAQLLNHNYHLFLQSFPSLIKCRTRRKKTESLRNHIAQYF